MKSVMLVSFLAVAHAGKDLIQLAQSLPQLSTFVQAVVRADLVEMLIYPGTFTVFAPTNDAFAALPAGLLDELFKPHSRKALVDVLTYHMLPKTFKWARVNQFSSKNYFQTVEGKPLLVSWNFTEETDGTVGAPGAPQRLAFEGYCPMFDGRHPCINMEATNGVMSIVDGVMLPSLVESGRKLSFASYKKTDDERCLEKDIISQADVQEGECGQGGSFDQRVFCDGGRVFALQYNSRDGSCQGPKRGDSVSEVLQTQFYTRQPRGDRDYNGLRPDMCERDIQSLRAARFGNRENWIRSVVFGCPDSQVV